VIVCKKPCTLYDADLLGGAGLLVLALAAWFVVLAPWQRMWHDYRRLVAARSAAESQLRDQVQDVERFEQGLAQLEEVVASEAAKAPRVDALSRLLQGVTDAALSSQLELLSVSPQPTVASGAYLVSDVRLGGRGSSRDFVRFLDRLARENPHQSLEACSITRSPQSADARCDLTWSLRLYLLPAEAPPAKGAGG
jgi:Tfp pilus assembly protein PilO